MSMWNDCPEPDLEPPEASLNYHEEEDEDSCDSEPDYEAMAERQREDLEWEADHAWYGNWNYPDDRW